jgi:hypothetical protein
MMHRLLLKLFRRRRLQQDLEAELTFHREMAAAGNNPIPFGNAGIIRERAFDLWRFNGLENLWRDLLFAVRTLRKSQGFVWTALLSLGLGIGVNAAIFSIATEFLLSEPSVRDAKSLVYVQQGGNSHMQPEVIEGLRRSGVFEDVAGENEELPFRPPRTISRRSACRWRTGAAGVKPILTKSLCSTRTFGGRGWAAIRRLWGSRFASMAASTPCWAFCRRATAVRSGMDLRPTFLCPNISTEPSSPRTRG